MSNPAGIYLIVEFDWPQPIEPDHAKKARRLHDVLQGREWIREMVAGSGGIDESPESLWIFRLESDTALDYLLHDANDEVSQAFTDFFSLMPVVNQKIREEVVFL